MTNKYKSLLTVFLLTLAFIGKAQSIEEELNQLASKYSFTFKKLAVDTFFEEKYVLMVEQLVDHQNPTGATFEQRVFLSHLSKDAPVVLITEGYEAHYAKRPKHINELTSYLLTNQICVEHRYFGESVPDSLNWGQLTVSNAAADHHHIVELLKNIYDKKWISTGISKGGQTATYFRYFYPDDVDISVPYVAPLNFSVEDQRVYRFLEQVGTKECRDKIYSFQSELLKNKDKYLDEFEYLAKEESLTYSMGIEKAYELTVLEYSFAFWQWGRMSCDDIPTNFSNSSKIIRHLNEVAGIGWISNEGIINLQPFFYQAMHELGFYGYDIEPFKEWVSYTDNPTFEFTLPEGVEVIYEAELNEQVDYFVRHKAENMMFIYGEFDAWSSTAVDLTYANNSVKIVKPGGSHATRIKNLDEVKRKEVLTILTNWLSEQD